MTSTLSRTFLASLLLLAAKAYADPYMGMEYQKLSGTRSDQSYATSQANVVVGYEWPLAADFKHGVEYTGPISTSTGQLGAQNVETTLMAFGYKLTYKGFYGKAAYVKLDRDDADLEKSKDRAAMYSVGYEHALDDTTTLRVSRDVLRSSAVSVSGFSAAVLFGF
ncbi:hypothetical protein B9Z36_09170 [Limnohabitans sp. Rim8]|uniref:hypothetical protein n=1 Tax=Limnohabitans sp. Rim8 TaxID=1100718 RepID=UPI000D36AC65|nr:hypothetical protein [Limnohabitans sp. Rim8]PUE57143.1 hypothetical protein B9Z36_09170 [Limnohabitans sp. Rim8]